MTYLFSRLLGVGRAVVEGSNRAPIQFIAKYFDPLMRVTLTHLGFQFLSHRLVFGHCCL